MRSVSLLAAITFSSIVALVFDPTGTVGQDPTDYRLLDTSTYLEMETISGLAISPDGRHVLFSRGWVDKMEDRTRSSLWIAETDGSRVRQLTAGTWSDFSPVWSPDGDRIAFLSDRDGSTQIYVLWLDTRETAQLTHLDQTPVSMQWSPDGQTLAFGMMIPDTDPILPVTLPEYPRGANLAPPAKVIDRIVFAFDGRGDLPRGDYHLYTLNVAAGGTPRQVTAPGHSFNNSHPPGLGSPPEIRWSRDGSKLYFVASLEPLSDSEMELELDESDIYSLDLNSGNIEKLTDREGPDRGIHLSPDGEWIAYTGFDTQEYADASISSLYLMDSRGERKRLLAGDLPSSPGSITWAADNSGVYYLMSEQGVSNVHFVSRQGDHHSVTTGNHVLSQLTVAKNGQAASVLSTPTRPGYLVTFPVDQPETKRTLVDVNADVLDGVRLGQVDELRFKAPDGLDLQGWLMKPAEFDPGQKYPLLLWIHGGPYGMYSVGWNWAWQNFAAQGYAVFFMNPRGSTGYGQDFADGIKHSFPGKDFDDLMAGVDAALEEGFIDPENLFVLGGSAGGLLTAYIVGNTHRFRAAAAMRPIVNYISLAGTSDDPTDKYSWFVKPHWEDPLDWYERSPIASVGNVETPVLIMTGERDLRTPMGQSEEFFRALKMQGKETLLIRMPEEFHGWRRPSHRILNQLYLQAWFEKYRM